MLPYTQNVSKFIPFDVNDLIDQSKIEILTEVPVGDNFVHKSKLGPEVLNPEFLKWLQDHDLDVQNVVVWHWLALDPHIAHIDCDSNGEIKTSCAINWTLNTNRSNVQFYAMPDVDKTVMYGNEASSSWVTPNVTAYIPVDVEGITPIASWADQGPCLINTSVPHMVVAPEIRTSVSLQFVEPWDFETVLEKVSNRKFKVIISNHNNPLAEKLDDCVFDYPIIDTGWIIKRWFKVDLEKLKEWHKETMNRYSDWVWRYGTHKYMWKYDPQKTVGKFFQPDTGWLMLTWGDDTKGPVPWLRTITKDEYNATMPQNRADHNQGLGPRECCFGYGLEIFENMPIPPHDIQFSIHTPGTKLPPHQDEPDKIRFHIAVETNPEAMFIINGTELHIPADGWCYIVNTTYLHSTDNRGSTDRVHIYGDIWMHDVVTLDLSNCETIL
jgi:hypothetical protein